MYIGGYNRARAAPPGLRNRRQLDRRGDGRVLQVILVKINADGSCTVVDDGRGIPVGIHPTEKIPTVEVVFATLAPGGKFEHNEGLRVQDLRRPARRGRVGRQLRSPNGWRSRSARDGKVHHMEFERGVKSQRSESDRQERQDRHEGHLQARCARSSPTSNFKSRDAAEAPARAGVSQRGRARSFSRTSASASATSSSTKRA